MTTQHTPGPWQIVSDPADMMGEDSSCEIWGPGAALVATVSGPDANARLIAAAPDLLDAVRGVDILYSEMQGALPALANTAAFDRITAAVKQARAAIAKAEGREP